MYLKMNFNRKKYKSSVIKSSPYKWTLDWKIESWNVSAFVFELWYKAGPMKKKFFLGQTTILPKIIDFMKTQPLLPKANQKEIVQGSLTFDAEYQSLESN